MTHNAHSLPADWTSEMMPAAGIYKLGQSSDYVGQPCLVCKKELMINDRVIFVPLQGTRHADCEPKKTGGVKKNAK